MHHIGSASGRRQLRFRDPQINILIGPPLMPTHTEKMCHVTSLPRFAGDYTVCLSALQNGNFHLISTRL